MLPIVRALLVLLIVQATAGCAGLFRAHESPEVYVIDVTPAEGESGLFEQRLKVDLRLRNPNDHDVTIHGLDFVLEVNGNRLARGLSNESVTVPRLGEAKVSAIASTTLMDVVRQVTKLGRDQNLMYAVKGTLHTGGGWGGRLPFESEGKLVDTSTP